MNILMKTSFVFFAVFLLTFTVSLAQKVETVDGVRVVHNGASGKWGKEPEVSIDFIKTIGEIESDDEAVVFFMPSDIAFDRQGNIYVLDTGNHRIQKFDAGGKYKATIGRAGQGPGEFQYPQALAIDSEGYLYVSDTGNRKIHVLKPDGFEFRTIQMTDQNPGTIRIDGSGRMIMGGSGMMLIGMGGLDEDQNLGKILSVLGPEGEVVQEFGDKMDFKDFLMNRRGNTFHFVVDRDGSVCVAFDHQNRIEKYSSEGALLWRAERELEFEATPPKKKTGRREVSGGLVEIRMPDMNRCANGIAVDGKGRVWIVGLNRQLREEEQVQTQMQVMMDGGGRRSMSLKPVGNTDVRKTDAFRLEVYSAQGELLGKLSLDHFADDLDINGDRLYILDRMRGSQYYEYVIIENGKNN
jgi:sugar lactone lactonase YvrE